jgi:hypothetical protein
MRHFASVILSIAALAGTAAHAQIRVDPHWVNTNTTGSTTVFLTFGGMVDYFPAEAVWCGEIMDAAPDIGSKPVPGTIFGVLPARFDLSTVSGTTGFTDIMSIPPSVTRRAYQAAASGAHSTFFYVRRFTSTTGGPDQFVAVTCELGSGGARTPFALSDVQLAFGNRDAVASINEGERPPSLSATIFYNGTGQLQGRWEIVKPGDELPTEQDLLTEATLPIEQRPQQRRYTELERFSVFLPPTGSYVLRGPDPSKLPSTARGLYMVLLRIESTPDVESTSHLDAVGAGPAPVAAGGAAGFPIPPLRYFVGGTPSLRSNVINLLSPADRAVASPESPVYFAWTEIPEGSLYRVVLIDSSNTVVFTALVRPGVAAYRLPSWIWAKRNDRSLFWSVEALDDYGEIRNKSEWRMVVRGGEKQP